MHAIPIIAALLARNEDVDDPHMPLMNWWALEAHADAWTQIESMLSEPSCLETADVRPAHRQSFDAALRSRGLAG